VADVHEEGHAEDGVDEHDEKEEETDVEERREGDGQREQQRPDALGRLDQTQDSTDTKHAHHAQQSRRYGEVFHDPGHCLT